MPMNVIFWVLMLIWLVFGLALNFGGMFVGHYGPGINNLLIFILFLLLGWHAFGRPVQ